MKDQKIFKRHEVKFRMTREQQEKLKEMLAEHMVMDEHGKSTVLSLYYDTPDHLLIRRSIEKPLYKEKLRLRSYGLAEPDSKVFLELKKKYNSVVYKRRICTTEGEAGLIMAPRQTGAPQDAGAAREPADNRSRGLVDIKGRGLADNKSRNLTNPAADGSRARGILQRSGRAAQITREIEFARDRYRNLAPACLISYDREAWYGKQSHDLRVTFDSNILWRNTALDLHTGIFGQPILGEDEVLMEVKTAEGIPLWLTSFLSREHIYKTSFSKYGKAYAAMLRETASSDGAYAHGRNAAAQAGRGPGVLAGAFANQLTRKGGKNYGFGFSGTV